MLTSKKNKRSSVKLKRLTFPEEKNLHWLPMLLDAYFIVDIGVTRAIDSEIKRGRRPACSKGCSNCCKTHRDIPVYPLELMGISWYVAEKVSGPVREVLKRQLRDHKENTCCPFLIEGACSIHLMRPMACRQFNVFNKHCSEGEDPFYSRPEDLLPPVKKHVDQAFFIMLPFHGIEKEYDRIKAVESGTMHKIVKNLLTCNWKLLAERMHVLDRKRKPRP